MLQPPPHWYDQFVMSNKDSYSNIMESLRKDGYVANVLENVVNQFIYRVYNP